MIVAHDLSEVCIRDLNQIGIDINNSDRYPLFTRFIHTAYLADYHFRDGLQPPGKSDLMVQLEVPVQRLKDRTIKNAGMQAHFNLKTLLMPAVQNFYQEDCSHAEGLQTIQAARVQVQKLIAQQPLDLDGKTPDQLAGEKHSENRVLAREVAQMLKDAMKE